MTMLIDPSYFAAGRRQILNASLGKGTTREGAAIEGYISDLQLDFLEQAVGHECAARAFRWLLCPGFGPDSDALRDLCHRLSEPFADYVFFHIIGDSGQQATVTGMVKLKCANEYVAPIVRQVETWNFMARRMRDFSRWAQSERCPFRDIRVDGNLTTDINRFNL